MNLEQEQESKKISELEKKRGRSKRRIVFWVVAAAILIILLSYFVMMLYTSSPTRIIEIYTRESEILKHNLPDGSTVWLNKNSRISYPENLNKTRREMHLIGEAYFEIEQDRWRPFLVHASNAVVEVLGTSFNLKTNRQKDTVELIVVTGSVSLYSERNPSEEVILEPGMAGFYYRATDAVFARQNLNVNFLAWQNNKLVFNDTPIHEVVEILNNKFETQIIIASLGLVKCNFTGTFEAASLKEILDYLTLSLKIEYTKEEDTYIITGTGC